MTLKEGIPGKEYLLNGMSLPLETERRLQALGLVGDCRVRVLRNKKRGAMIVKIRGTRFALGETITKHIEVKEDGLCQS